MYKPPDTRSDLKKADDLLKEVKDEVEIESHRPDPVTYIEQRLKNLRQDPHQEENEQPMPYGRQLRKF